MAVGVGGGGFWGVDWTIVSIHGSSFHASFFFFFPFYLLGSSFLVEFKVAMMVVMVW